MKCPEVSANVEGNHWDDRFVPESSELFT